MMGMGVNTMEGEMYQKNVFELLNENELNFILSSFIREDIQQNYSLNDVGIFIHLFYSENIDFFLNYIKNVPAGMDIYISVVTDDMKQQVENYLNNWGITNCNIIIKENRGRDVSALLVAFRKRILQYKYACFVHDKRQKYDGVTKKEIDMWIRCLWDSMLSSQNYVFNVLNLLEKNKDLGLLVPPEIAGVDLGFSYSDTWRDNFFNTLKLAKKMNLDCNICKEYPPVTLGTVFWCKTAALEKLLKIEWTYEEFQQEPLKDDFTMNHAIERIFGYVAQDAGYQTGYIMSDLFAQSYILQLKDTLRKLFRGLTCMERMFSTPLDKLELWNYRKNRIISYTEKYEKIYFYGAGKVGAKCYQMMMFEKKNLRGFIVSVKKDNQKEYLGLPIFTLNEIEKKENVGIVITVGEDYKDEIVEKLKDYGFKNYIDIT